MCDYQKQFEPFFHQLADAARGITLNYFRKSIPIDEKDDRSPVTTADQEIETRLRDMIAKEFPAHGIIGEEFGKSHEDAEFVWVIDPIDGTRAFMTGKPLFGTIIGLMHNGKPAVGLIDQGFTNERWFGVMNKMATHNGAPIHVAPPRKLEAARMYTGSPNMFEGKNFDGWVRLCRAAKWPQYGADCYAYGLVAMGWADVCVEQCLKIHDVAGIAPIITGAGGFMSDWRGQPITMAFEGYAVAASCKELAMEASALFS